VPDDKLPDGVVHTGLKPVAIAFSSIENSPVEDVIFILNGPSAVVYDLGVLNKIVLVSIVVELVTVVMMLFLYLMDLQQ